MTDYVATVYQLPGSIVVRINGTNYMFSRNPGGLTVTTKNFKVEKTWTPIYSQVVKTNLLKTARSVLEHAAKKFGKGWMQGM